VGRNVFLGVSHALAEESGGPALPNFGSSIHFMQTPPFDAEIPSYYMWEGACF